MDLVRASNESLGKTADRFCTMSRSHVECWTWSALWASVGPRSSEFSARRYWLDCSIGSVFVFMWFGDGDFLCSDYFVALCIGTDVFRCIAYIIFCDGYIGVYRYWLSSTMCRSLSTRCAIYRRLSWPWVWVIGLESLEKVIMGCTCDMLHEVKYQLYTGSISWQSSFFVQFFF